MVANNEPLGEGKSIETIINWLSPGSAYHRKVEANQALLALVKTEVEKTKVAFAKDMLEMDKWNEKARTDELHKIIRQSAEKQRLNEREDK